MESNVVSRRDDSHVLSRKADNLIHRPRATSIASIDKPRFSPQRTLYNRRQSLSKSYDSPEGLGRISRLSPKKAGPLHVRRSASPPASCSIGKHNHSAIGRDQKVLEDAAWMSERIQNLHKTGFVRSPLMSKLRVSNHIGPPGQLRFANKQDCEELSCSSSTSSYQNSTRSRSQTGPAATYEDEPLSAFRLSEVILSEEDLLTDISSTCASTPVSLQSGRIFDHTASENYHITSFSLNAERNGSDTTHHDSAASLKSSPLNKRSELLHRLEALQYRAELAAKTSHSKDFDSCEDKQCFKDPWTRQVMHSNQNSSPSDQKQCAVVQGGNLLSAASPIQPSIESTFWPEEVKTKPYVSQLIRSSSRTIRPEYYLPLSKEEKPEIKAVPSRISSPNEGRKSELRVDNSRGLGLRGSSTVCQLRAEDSRHGKSLTGHKQTYPARKFRRFSKGSMNSVNRPVTTRSIISIPGSSTLNSCPTGAREAHSTDVKSSENSNCGEYNGFANFSHIENISQKAADHDGEVSWISEENVEGFLSSRTFAVDEVDALNTSNEYTASSGSSITSLYIANRKVSSQTQNHDAFLIKCGEESLSSSSEKRNGHYAVTTGGCRNKSMEDSAIVDHGNRSFQFSEGNQTINNQTYSQHQQTINYQTSSQSQLSEGGPLACSQYQLSEGGEGKSLDPVLLEHYKPIDENVQAKGTCKDARPDKKLCCKEKHVSCDAVDCRDADGEAIGSQTPTLESQHHVQSKQRLGPCQFDNSTTLNRLTSSDATMSSPEMYLTEYRNWPFVAKRCNKASPLQNLIEREPSHHDHRIFARITRSLSFSENEKNELQISSKQNLCNDPSELKSTSFSHYWIRNSAYSLDFSELLNGVENGSRKADQGSFPDDLVDIQHGLKPQQTSASVEKKLLEEVQSEASRFGSSHMDKKHGVKHNISSWPNESCKVASEFVGGEVLTVNSIKSLQHCDQCGLDNLAEKLYRLKDDFNAINGFEDKSNWHQPKDACEVPNGKSEMCDEVVHHETVIEKDAALPSIHRNEREKTEHDIIKESTLLEQAVSSSPLKYCHNNSLSEDVTKGSNIPKTSCSLKNEASSSETTKAESSVLSVYKNPLWLDENSKEFENDHAFPDQEFVDFTCRSERNVCLFDSDNKRHSFSKRFEEKTWDTYEGMGAFISSFPNSPCAEEGVSDASDNLLGFVNSGNLSNSLWDVKSKAENNPKNITEDDQDKSASVCESQFSETCSQLKDMCKKPCGARSSDGLENFLSDQVLWPDSTKLMSTIVATKDVALVTSRSTVNHIVKNVSPIHSNKRENMLLTEMPRQADEAKAGTAVNEVNHDSKAHGTSSKQLVGVNATERHSSSSDPVVHSNDETESSEEVKQVMFVYSDTKEPPQKNVQTLPEVPLDLLSTWVWPLFSHATKGGNLKKREQRQPLIQDNFQKDQTDWNRIGRKVEALEAEIDKFKRENRKLHNLVKFIIRKMKQLRLGFRARKRRATSRGFMTCFCSVRIHRRKYSGTPTRISDKQIERSY